MPRNRARISSSACGWTALLTLFGFFTQPLLDAIAFKFPKGVFGYPARRFGIQLGDLPRRLDSAAVERQTALAKLAQRPIDCLLYEVALVCGIADDQGEDRIDLVLGASLVMPRQPGHERKTGAAHEFVLTPRPLDGLFVSKGSLVDQVPGETVAYIPGIQILNPGLSLVFGHLLGIVNNGRKQTRFVITTIPKLQG